MDVDDQYNSASAVISDCGLYRYALTRSWCVGPRMTFIMLNPSTADAHINDPTIRRCIGFARREGMGGITVVNLFAFRATDPKQLTKAEDPVGPENAKHIKDALDRGYGKDYPVVCAWGASDRAAKGSGLIKHWLVECGSRVVFLGQTATGAPGHPLYIKASAPLIPYWMGLPYEPLRQKIDW